MKRIILAVLFLVVLTTQALGTDYAYLMGGRPAPGGAACMSVTVDEWQQLESVPTTGNWALTGTGTLSAASAAENATLSCPGGTTDTGTNGMSVDLTATSESYITRTFTAKTSASTGFWINLAVYDNWKDVVFFKAWDGSKNIMRLKVTRDNTTTTMAFVDGTPSGSVTLSHATWYWVSIQIVKNSTSTVSVYGATGTLIGSATATAANFDITKFSYGLLIADAQSAGRKMYIDDILLDITDATHPLGP